MAGSDAKLKAQCFECGEILSEPGFYFFSFTLESGPRKLFNNVKWFLSYPSLRTPDVE